MLDVPNGEDGDASSMRDAENSTVSQKSTPDALLDDRIKEAARRLFDAAGAIAVILFGSRARGTARQWSDWDLCVILPDDASTKDLTPFRLRPLTSDIGVPIDVVTIRKEVFVDCIDRQGSLSHEIARDGKVIIGKLDWK